MSKIPTAEEFLTISDEFEVLETRKQEEVVTKTMIEFAKLHVEAALKEASEKAKTFDVYNESCGDLECKVTFIKKDSIINSYPLENIK